MKQLRFLIIIVILLSFSCQKKVSNEIDFIGQWIEKGKIGVCTIEFTGNGAAFFNLYSNDNVQEYAYRFDEDASEELTIWGLYISTPENPSKTVLTKV